MAKTKSTHSQLYPEFKKLRLERYKKNMNENEKLNNNFNNMPYDIQKRIVLYNKNNLKIESLQEEIGAQQRALQRNGYIIEQLRLTCDAMDQERVLLRRLNHDANLENLRLRKSLRRTKMILSNVTSEITRNLNFAVEVEAIKESEDESEQVEVE